MSMTILNCFSQQAPLNFSLINPIWEWPSKEALSICAQSLSSEEVATINRDIELFARTRLKSCRLIKFLRDAQDAAWDLANEQPEAFKAAS